MNHGPRLILITGPTGTGKSRVAAIVAKRVGGEIINADSVQIYRGFDIGSAKPTPVERSEVPHHLYDEIDATQHLDVALWVEMADRAIDEIASRTHVPIVVGGTNFYLRALLRGLPELPPRQPELRRRLDSILARPSGPRHLHRLLKRIDPVSARKVGVSDRHRIERAIEVFAASGKPISSFEAPSPDHAARYAHLQFALTIERPRLMERLDARVERMYGEGLVEEVRTLRERYGAENRPMTTIGYREALDHLEGRRSLADAISETKRRTRAYAKRQMTWLRAEQDVQWLDATRPAEEIAEAIERTFRRESSG